MSEKWRRDRWFVLATVFLLLNAYGVFTLVRNAGGRDGVSVVAFSPGDERPVGEAEPLLFRFSEAMVSAEKIGGSASPGALSLDPRVEGEFAWTAADTLTFTPRENWKKCSLFDSRLDETLTSLSGRMIAGQRVFRFHSEPLRLLSVAQSNFNAERQATLRFEFNDAVSPSVLASALALASDRGKAIDFFTLGGTDSAVLLVQTSSAETDRIRIKIGKGLTGVSGPLGLSEAAEETIALQAELALLGLDPSSRPFSGGSITASFTASLDLPAAARFIAVEPPVAIVVEPLYSWGNEARCRIEGDFEPARSYTLTFLQGLPAAGAPPLSSAIVRTVYFPDRPPALSLSVGGNYLSTRGNLLLPVRTVNVPSFKLEVNRIFPNNLVAFALRDLGESWYGWGKTDRDLSRRVDEKEYRTVGENNRSVETLIDLGPYLADAPSGAFFLTARAEGAEAEDRLAVVTDTAISAKLAPHDLLVWANSIHSPASIEKAEVTVYSRANQALLSGATDPDGLARFSLLGLPAEEKPFLITVKKGEDISYLCLEGTEVSAAADPEGRGYLSEGYEAFLFTDRGIYRPGETARGCAIVRGRGVSRPPAFPVSLRVVGPLGKTERTLSASLDDLGTAEFEIPFPAYSLTGRRRLEIALPGDEGAKLGETEIALEDFVPPQIEVTAGADEGRAEPGLALSFSVAARHLFGRPAAGAPVRAWAEFLAEEFAPSGWEGWTFGDPEKKTLPPSADLGAGSLDENGEAEFTVSVPESYRPAAALAVSFGCSVTEIGGRSVADYRSRVYDAYPFYVGLQTAPPEGGYRTGENIPLDVAAVRADGSVDQEAQRLALTLSRVFWSSALKKNDAGRYAYVSERQISPVHEETLPLANGRVSAAFSPPQGGEYLLTVSDPDSGSSTSLSFFAADPGQQWFAGSLETPEKVVLSLDRKSYLPGETATLLIKSPFPGRALLSLESDRVLQTRVLTLDKNTAQAAIPVLPEYSPNVHCVVSVIRPVRPGEPWAAHRAAGTVPLSVDSPERKLSLSLAAPEAIRPGEKLEVSLSLADSRGAPRTGEAVVAAVDDGICLLTDFPVPDPFAFFFGPRRLEVALHDLYALLMPETEKKISDGAAAPGGDGEMGAALRRRLNPIRSNRFKPVALWSSRVSLGADGKGSVTFAVPEFTGRLRLAAVAVDQQGFASARADVLVKRPLVVRSSLPRFLAPSDRAVMPVEVFNETGAPGEVRITAEGTGGILFTDNGSAKPLLARDLRLEAGESKAIEIALAAPDGPAAASVTLAAALGKETYREVFEIPVRPAEGLSSKSGWGRVAPGESAEIEFPGGYLPGTIRGGLQVSGRPTVKLGGALSYLLAYPYGCIEQTVSASFPLLYLSDLVEEVRPGALGKEETNRLVEAGILRVLSMQLGGGGFSSWPAGRDLYEWGSIYAAHFLVEAGRAGYAVPKDRREEAISFLRKILSRTAASGNVDTPSFRDEMYLKSYAALVLSLAGRPENGWIERLSEQRDRLDPSARLNLAGSLIAAGRKEEAASLLASPGPVPEIDRERGACLRSRARDDALLLSLRLDLDPQDPTIPLLAGRLESAAENGRWATTQENALALMALGKYSRFSAGTAKKVLGSVQGLSGEPTAITDQSPFHRTFDSLPGETVRVVNQGEGDIFYHWSVEGVSAHPEEKETDSGLLARRVFRDLSLREIDPSQLVQGDLVVVEVVLDAGEEYLDNVAVEELLPAGLEIENPDLKTSRLVPGLKDQATLPVRHADLRDDRLLIFTGGFSGLKSFFYAARAVSPGEFILPAISASCMYDPSIRSVHGRGKITVISNQ
jgi:hypothetical protein